MPIRLLFTLPHSCDWDACTCECFTRRHKAEFIAQKKREEGKVDPGTPTPHPEAGLGHRNGCSPVKGRRGGFGKNGAGESKDGEEAAKPCLIINGPTNNVAAGGGLRGIRHLRKNPKVLTT